MPAAPARRPARCASTPSPSADGPAPPSELPGAPAWPSPGGSRPACAPARGQARPGFQAHADGAVTPAAALQAGLALHLGGRLALVAGTRLLFLWRPPEIWGDTAPIARVAPLAVAGWAGLRFDLR